MPLQVTALYAGLLGAVGIVLLALVGPARRRAGASLGDAGDKALTEAIRRHMNWVENVPFILVLLAIIEINGGPKAWLHVLGGVLVAARILHPFGIDAGRMMRWPRVIGAGATILVTIAAIVTVLWQALAP